MTRFIQWQNVSWVQGKTNFYRRSVTNLMTVVVWQWTYIVTNNFYISCFYINPWYCHVRIPCWTVFRNIVGSDIALFIQWQNNILVWGKLKKIVCEFYIVFCWGFIFVPGKGYTLIKYESSQCWFHCIQVILINDMKLKA